MKRYTKEQLAQIIAQLQAVSVDSLPVFQVSVINAHTDEPIELSQVRGSGVVYIRIGHGSTARNFPVYVEVVV